MKLLGRRGKLISGLVLIGLVLVIGSGFLWWHSVRSQPDDVFWGMLGNSLQTRSVTHSSIGSSDGQQSVQTSRLQTAPSNIILGVNKIQQQTATGTTKVNTETIGTPFVDYVRYTEISSTEKDSQGKSQNYSNVVNVWGKSTQNDPKSADGQLYNQAVLGVIPFANISGPQRDQIVNQMRSQGAYTFDKNKVKREVKNHRPVYTYDVTIKPAAYVSALKSLSSMIGLTQLESVNPADYQTTPEAHFQVVVDVWSRAVTVIAQQDSGSLDAFGSFGLISIDTTLPAKTTTIDDLQSKLQPANSSSQQPSQDQTQQPAQ